MEDIRLNIEALSASGVSVTNHGEDVASEHAQADTRIETAQVGWRGLSQAAIAARFETWQATTATLLTHMSDHAQGLHRGARCFSEFEAQRQREMQELAARGDAAAKRADQRL